MLNLIYLQETIFFSHWQGELCQWLELGLENTTQAEVGAEVAIMTGGKSAKTALRVMPGEGRYRAYAPALWPSQPAGGQAWLELSASVEAPTPVGEGIAFANDTTANPIDRRLSQEITVGSHRPWVVYLLSDVCTDDTWVYADEGEMRRDDAALLAEELRLAEAYFDQPGTNRNHYNLVHSRQVEYFLEAYPDQTERLFDHFRQGDLTLNPILNMTLTSDLSLEALIRTLYPARRLARQYGLDAPAGGEHRRANYQFYANLQETPTTTWGMASVLAGCGITHLVRSILPYECPWARRITEPPVYQWEGPDGSRVMVRLRNQDYVEGNFVLQDLEATNQALHEQTLPVYANLAEPYPFDAIALVGCYGDLAQNSRELPAKKAVTVSAYNAQGWEYPKLVNASHKQFWDDIDGQIAARSIRLSVARGDYGAGWEAWPACLAHDFAGWRRAMERAATADRLAAILACLEPAWYAANRAGLDKAWFDVCLLADHAWNGANETNRKLNAALRREWQTEANTLLDHLIASGLSVLADRIPGDEADDIAVGTPVAVFNALGWGRDGLVRLKGDLAAAHLSTQSTVENGKIVHYALATGIPSVGYRVINPYLEGDTDFKVRVGEATLESPFYRLEIDPVSGGIASLYDKVRGCQLVDASSPYRLNEPVYLCADGPTPPSGPYELFKRMDLSGMNESRSRLVHVEAGSSGALFAELLVHSAIGEIQFTTSYRLFTHFDRLDIRNEVEKPVNPEKQELDFAFPFNIPGRQYRVETPGAILDPEADYRSGAGLAFTSVRHFVDVFNQDYGVTLAMAESGVVEFGHRTTGEDPHHIDPSNATLVCLALENCIDWNESIHDQGGVTHFTYRYSLRGHAGGFDPVAALHFGWEMDNELLAFALPVGQAGDLGTPVGVGSPAGAHSFLGVSPDNVILVGFKPAEIEQGSGHSSRSVLARMWEVSGRETTVFVQVSGLKELWVGLPAQVGSPTLSACRTNLLEDDLEDLPISRNLVQFNLPARGLAAVRIQFN